MPDKTVECAMYCGDCQVRLTCDTLKRGKIIYMSLTCPKCDECAGPDNPPIVKELE